MVERIRSTRRRIMRTFKLSEISAVDNPAQEHARMVLMKRADDVDKAARTTSSVNGHTHTYDGSGRTSEDKGHSHPVTVAADGSVTIGSAAGHTHSPAAVDKNDIEKVYKTTSDLPEAVRSALPEPAQRQFMAVANAVLADDGSDTSAFKQAWGAVKAAGWHKGKDDKWVKKDYYGRSELTPACASAIATDVQALDFEAVLAADEAIQATYQVKDEVWRHWNALQRSFETIAADEDVAAAEKVTAMRASLDQFIASLAEESRDDITKCITAVPVLAGLLAKEEGDVPMTAAEKQQLAELQKSVAALTTKLEAATDADPAKKAADLAGELETAKAELAELTEKLATSDVEKATALAKAGMSDDEKEYMDKLEDEDERKAFMGMSAEDRAKKIKKAVDADPVVYKSESTGEAFRKSDDPRLVKMAKQADESEKIAKEEREKRENAELAKRADDELKPFSESIAKRDDKIEVLRVIDTMAEGPKAALLKMLEVGGKAIEAAFQTIGHRSADVVKSAQAFEKHVSDIQARDKITKAAAMSKARTEHPDAYAAYQEADGSAN